MQSKLSLVCILLGKIILVFQFVNCEYLNTETTSIKENGEIETFRLLDDEDDVLHIFIIALMFILIIVVVIYFCYQNYFKFKTSEYEIKRLKTFNQATSKTIDGSSSVQTDKIVIQTKDVDQNAPQ